MHAIAYRTVCLASEQDLIMAEAPQDFDAMFRSLVVPDLRKRCRYVGSQIALDVMDFHDGNYRVWREAMQRGGSCLPAERQSELEDWILTSILKSEEKFRSEVWDYRTVVDRVAADIARTEARWHEIWSAEGG